MAADVTIRPATADDTEALGRLAAMLVRVHHEFDATRFFPPSEGTARGYGGFLSRQIGREDAFVLVAEAAGAVVGYAYAALEGPDYMALRGPAGVLHDILVDPDHRTGGVGHRLLEAVMARLTQMGAPRIMLHTAERNATAQRLFSAAGFRPTMLEMTWDAPGKT